MAKAESHTNKLLNYWNPPASSGEPVGCMTTSFTFDSEFFEEECISRFLQMDTDPKEDGPLYLIEREEKLAQVEPISVIVDEAHCRGKRSLRWDLISFRSSSLLHSKITILVWANHVRIIIGSGNLTPNGYRINKEIFGVYNFNSKMGVDQKALTQSLSFFNLLFDQLNDNNPAVKRALSFIEKIPLLTKEWDKQRIKKGVERKILMTGSGFKNLLSHLNQEVKKKGETIQEAHIVSPFYVDPGAQNPAIKYLGRIFSNKDESIISWYGRIDVDTEQNNKLFYGPSSLKEDALEQGIKKVRFYGIIEKDVNDKNQEVFRPLHLKSIWLESPNYVFYSIGSSNFTTNGLGISKRPNFESNVLYIINKTSAKKIYKDIKGSFPKSTYLGRKVTFCEDLKNVDQRKTDDAVILPSFFNMALYDRDGDRTFLKLSFNLKEKNSLSWKILDEGKKVVFTSDEWFMNKHPESYKIEWHQTFIPSDLTVKIEDDKEYRWSVIAMDSSVLPIPDDLGDLDLEILIQLLATNKPLHHAMRKWLKKTDQGLELQTKELLNPHDKVDVSSFLLRRTRKISYAFSMLRTHMERPFYTKATLHWRFYGPVGVFALSKAILKEAKSEEEKIFLIVELCLELSQINIATGNGCLSKDVVGNEIKKLIRELRKKSRSIQNKNSMIKEYATAAFNKSLKSVQL